MVEVLRIDVPAHRFCCSRSLPKCFCVQIRTSKEGEKPSVGEKELDKVRDGVRNNECSTKAMTPAQQEDLCKHIGIDKLADHLESLQKENILEMISGGLEKVVCPIFRSAGNIFTSLKQGKSY